MPVLTAAPTEVELPSVMAAAVAAAACEDRVPSVAEEHAVSAVRPWAGQVFGHFAAAGCPAKFAVTYGTPALGRTAALAVEKIAGAGAALLAETLAVTEGTSPAIG